MLLCYEIIKKMQSLVLAKVNGGSRIIWWIVVGRYWLTVALLIGFIGSIYVGSLPESGLKVAEHDDHKDGQHSCDAQQSSPNDEHSGAIRVVFWLVDAEGNIATVHVGRCTAIGPIIVALEGVGREVVPAWLSDVGRAGGEGEDTAEDGPHAHAHDSAPEGDAEQLGVAHQQLASSCQIKYRLQHQAISQSIIKQTRLINLPQSAQCKKMDQITYTYFLKKALLQQVLAQMEGNESCIKYKYFRQKKQWEQLASQVCNWVNVNINVIRITSIASVLCHFNNQVMVNLYYDDTKIPEDILNQTSSQVLTFQVFKNERTMMHSWKVQNDKILPGINQIARRGTILAINSLQHDQKHDYNVTIVWYKRNK